MKKLFLIAVLLIFINSDITFASNWKQIDNGLFMDTDSITTYIDKLGFSKQISEATGQKNWTIMALILQITKKNIIKKYPIQWHEL